MTTDALGGEVSWEDIRKEKGYTETHTVGGIKMHVYKEWKRTHFDNWELRLARESGSKDVQVARIWEVHDGAWMWEVKTSTRIIVPKKPVSSPSLAKADAVYELSLYEDVEWV